MNEGYTTLDAAYAAARWGWYIAAFLVLGAGSYAPFLFRGRTGLHAIEPELSDQLTRRAAAIGVFAALALMLATVLKLYLQARTLVDPDEPASAELVRAILASDWGRGWIRQAVVAGFTALAFTAARSGSGFGWTMAVASGGGLGMVAGMTGHAATAKAGSYGLLIDTAHVWAGGLWLGGLAVLVLAGVPACRNLPGDRRVATVRALVADFSRRALIFAPLTVGLGIWLAARYLGWSFPLHLRFSGYTGVLLLKIVLLVMIGALGAYNWRVVQPGLVAPAGERRLLGATLLELVFGVLLLAATAVLVALPMPGDEM